MKLSCIQTIKVGGILIPAYISAFTSRLKNRDGRYKSLRKWSRITIKALGYDLQVEGIENIPMDETVYFVSNHQGTLDPAIIIASCPKTMSFISKIENKKLPLFGNWSKTIGVLHFNRNSRDGNIHMLRESARQLKQGHSLLIFPEGTRSKGDMMNPFKVGSMQPAYLAKVCIVPITLNNAYILYTNPTNKTTIKVTYGKPIYYEEYKQYNQKEITQHLYKIVNEKIVYQ